MDPEVRAFYMDGFGEDERLLLRAHGVLERVRTQELLTRLLPPPPATVLDIGSDGRLTEAVEPFLHRLHATGQFCGDVVGFTTAYFHFPDELAQDLVDAGLRGIEVYGIEGPAGPTLRALGMDCLDERLDAAVRAARIVERDSMMIAASGHLLAVGRV